MYLFDYEKAGSFKGGGVGVFHSVFPLFYNLSLCMFGYKVGDEFSKLRGRKGNRRRGKKTMERGKGKGRPISGKYS